MIKTFVTIVSTITIMTIQIGLCQDISTYTTEEPPTNYTSNNQVTGIVTDTVEEIKKIVGNKFETQSIPWSRLFHMISTTPNILAFTVAKTKEREDLGFHFIGPVITREYVLMRRTGENFNINNISDIRKRKLTVGAMRDGWRSKFFKSKDVIVDDAVSHELTMKKLLNKRFDLWVISDLEYPYIMKLAGININRVEKEYTFRIGSSYIVFSPLTKSHIVKKWRDAFNKLKKTDKIKAISNKWSDKLGIKISFSERRGFHISDKSKKSKITP